MRHGVVVKVRDLLLMLGRSGGTVLSFGTAARLPRSVAEFRGRVRVAIVGYSVLRAMVQ